VVDGGVSPLRGFLFDTNVLIASLRGEEDVSRRLADLPPESLFVPAIALGELYFGARKSGRPTENLARSQEFAANSNVLPCDEATARVYGSVRDALRRRGRPIPENDIWIAAVALQHDLVLASRDSHFEHVEGLRLDQW
jgi:tRNA(fMet)-specific endonuclease VapC